MKAVFLDRDGVLNHALIREGRPYAPARPDEFVLVPGVGHDVARLKAAGFVVLVATNQPEIARGNHRREDLAAMHARLASEVPVDEILVCFHDDADQCHCRKPKPGLLLDGARKYGASLADSYMVGDRWRDIEAGQRAGVRTIFLDFQYAERRPSPPADVTVGSLAEAVDWILNQQPTQLGDA